VRADGELGWLDVRGEVVRAASGEIAELRGTMHEVTVRHRAEEARIKANTVESASRNKSELMSRVSHELRTPLNAILGFAQLCQSDDTLDPKHRGWAEVIVGSGQHMLDLVDEMLDMSAAEAGQLAINPTAVELVSLLRECLLGVSEQARAAGLSLQSMDGDAAPIEMRCDPKRLKQVIGNLLSNAVKYTRAGGLIKVAVADLGSSVEVAVQDTGIGLSADQLDRLFRPFERLGAETTATPGTGLGLVLSKTMIELMGGTVRVHSEAGVGSTFTVSLPKYPDCASCDERTRSVPSCWRSR
jgi:signal transduction histidine kinase